MGLGIWALLTYIFAIILWNSVLKRNIGEAMGIGLICVVLFSGTSALSLLRDSFIYASKQKTVFAALAFVFMAYIMTETGLVNRLVDILNSLLGRLPGGAGYISTLASALFGLISGSGSGNAASVGSVTIPWMVNSNWPSELAAVVVSGNAGLGVSLPPNSSMFILMGTAIVAEKVSSGSLYLALLGAGLWTLMYRLLLVRYFVYKYDIKPLPDELIKPLNKTLKDGWSSLLIFIGVILPVVLTIGPVSEMLKSNANFGADAVKAISIIVWIPVLISLIAIVEGRKYLPKTFPAWLDFIKKAVDRYTVVGATLFFAFSASYSLNKIGLADDLTTLLSSLNVSKVIMVILVGVLINLVTGPLTATATVAAIGAVGFSALTQVGLKPAVAAACVLIFASMEGATPPNSAPIYISCGMANVDPVRTFVPLIKYYVIPVITIGCLIALGFLPIFGI